MTLEQEKKLDSFTELHELIKDGKINEIKTFLVNQNIQDIDYFFNENNESAASTAVRSKKFDIYELLLSHGVCFGPDESMEKFVEGFPPSETKKLRKIHRKFFKDSCPKHVMILCAKTKLGCSTLEIKRRRYRSEIIRAYEYLSRIKMIDPILKVASTSKELQIVFDFHQETIENLDTTNTCIDGENLFYDDDLIFIGAKSLLSENEHKRTLTAIVRELCHFAMVLFYKNQGKPYHDGDLKTCKNFQLILEKTEKIKNKCSVIMDAFEKFHPKVQHQQLIACVPEVELRYFKHLDKHKNATRRFSTLFDFYEKRVLPDLIQAYPLMDAKNVIKNVNLMNNTLAALEASGIELTAEEMEINLGENDEILFVISNNPQLTMNAIYQKFKKDFHFESTFIFANLETLRNVKILDLTLKAMKLTIKLNLIIDCRGQENVDQIISKIRKKEIKQKIVFVSTRKLSNDTCINVKHTWDHLTTDCQQKVLLRSIELKGIELPLGESIENVSSIDSIPFKDSSCDRKIVIGEDIDFKTPQKFVARKFFLTDSERNESFDIDEVLDFTQNVNTILLSDVAGMGKSTTFKMLQLHLKLKHRNRWIVLVDLRNHHETFEDDSNVKKFETCEDIVHFFEGKILKLSDFEALIFKKLFTEGRVIILLDGLDQIHPNHKTFIFDLMIAIQKLTTNQLWISTRPYLERELKNILHPTVFRLKGFSESDRVEFFEKFFMQSGIDDLEHKLKKFLNQTQIKNWKISNPLLLKMIAESLIKNDGHKSLTANLFEVYKKFVVSKEERCMEKSHAALKSLVDTHGKSNILNFYYKNAFKVCFENSCFKKNVEQLANFCFKHVSTPSADECVRVGFIFYNDSANFRFIDNTIADFYVANYFFETLFCEKFRSTDELKTALMVFVNLLNSFRSFGLVISFLCEALEPLLSNDVTDQTSFLKLLEPTTQLYFEIIEIWFLFFQPKPQKLPETRNDEIILAIKSICSNDFFSKYFANITGLTELKLILVMKDCGDRKVIFNTVCNQQCQEVQSVQFNNFALYMNLDYFVNKLKVYHALLKQILNSAALVEFNQKMNKWETIACFKGALRGICIEMIKVCRNI